MLGTRSTCSTYSNRYQVQRLYLLVATRSSRSSYRYSRARCLFDSTLVVMSTSTHCEVSTRWVLTQRNTYIYRYSNSWHIPSKTYLVPPISCWLVMAYQQRTITGSRAGDSTNLISVLRVLIRVLSGYSCSLPLDLASTSRYLHVGTCSRMYSCIRLPDSLVNFTYATAATGVQLFSCQLELVYM